MWKNNRPKLSAKDAFEASISRIRDNHFKQRLDSIIPTIILESATYQAEAQNANLCAIPSSNGVNGVVTTEEMKVLYDDRMAHPKGPARHIYDQILASAHNSRCPLCGHRSASTLDHVLPKSRFPVFAVTPDNLVPACKDCNKTKSNSIITLAEEQYLHPYFDDIENSLWLHAQVIESTPAAVRFFVLADDALSEVMKRRIYNHFNRLGLSSLYASQAGEEITNIQHLVSITHQGGGARAVKKFLTDSHYSRSIVRINSWQTAFYAALMNSDWYCNGGFAL